LLVVGKDEMEVRWRKISDCVLKEGLCKCTACCEKCKRYG